MKGINKIIASQIPEMNYLPQINIPRQQERKKKQKSHRITEIGKDGKPRIKKNVSIERAAEILFMFENTDLTPRQIEELKVTAENLRQRVKKLEDWQEC